MQDQENNLVQTAYDAILSKVLLFELKPGDVVSDAQLSKELGMSRTPVREAIRRLQYETLVTLGEHNKLLVSSITAEDVVEITEVRQALELQAAEAVVVRNPMSQLTIKRLRYLNEQIETTIIHKSFRENFRLEDEFHSLIVDSARNRRLSDMYRQIHLLIVRARWLSLFYPHFDKTPMEHNNIIDGLEKRDLEKTLAAVRLHMEGASKHFSRVFVDEEMQTAAQAFGSIFGRR